MDTKQYKTILSPTFIEEIEEIHFYILKKLQKEKLAKKFIKSVKNKIQKLKQEPYMYPKLETKKRLQKIYRKVVVEKYVIIYNIDDKEKIVYIVHIYSQKENYIDKM